MTTKQASSRTSKTAADTRGSKNKKTSVSTARRASSRPAVRQAAVVKDASSEPIRAVAIREHLVIGKRVVDSGAVRLSKKVHTEHVAVDEPVATEVVSVERVAVNRILDGPVEIRHEGDVMIVPVVAERVVVRRERVLVEEIRITRRTVQTRAKQTVPVRREEITAERLDPASGEWKEEGRSTAP